MQVLREASSVGRRVGRSGSMVDSQGLGIAGSTSPSIHHALARGLRCDESCAQRQKLQYEVDCFDPFEGRGVFLGQNSF